MEWKFKTFEAIQAHALLIYSILHLKFYNIPKLTMAFHNYFQKAIRDFNSEACGTGEIVYNHTYGSY